MNLQDDVYWLDTGTVNCYLCRDDDGLTLIDTGMPRQQAAILGAIETWGHTPADLKRILITHADIDHAGSLAAIQEATGAAVYAGPETAALLLKGRSPRHLPALAQFVIDTFVRYRPVDERALHVVADGDTLPVLGGMQAIATPGHTLDHHSFYSPSAGILFTGDALHTSNDRLERTEKRITADETAANRSAIALIELAPAVIACGHGEPATGYASSDLMTLSNEIRRQMGE